MIKIISDIYQLIAINNAASVKENNPSVKYCDIIKHPIREEWVIPIDEVILKSYELNFITDEWLNSNLVEELPEDWNWPFPQQLRIRISDVDIVDLLSNYSEFIGFIDTMKDTTVKSDGYRYIYLSVLYPEHEYILSQLPSYLKEEKP